MTTLKTQVKTQQKDNESGLITNLGPLFEPLNSESGKITPVYAHIIRPSLRYRLFFMYNVFKGCVPLWSVSWPCLAGF